MVFALLSFTDQWKLIVVAFSAKLVNNQRTASATHRLLPHRNPIRRFPFPFPFFPDKSRKLSIQFHHIIILKNIAILPEKIGGSIHKWFLLRDEFL
ncbi:hypothetical protein RB195_011020 [Necator americanus]|uniref:Uncharacterized protein n=1 Tax=Necator americanus TaxID=51031 RepID=A0ABR1D2A5_NECAM